MDTSSAQQLFYAALRTEGKEKLLIIINLTDEVIQEHVLPDAYSLKGVLGGDSAA